MATNLFRLVMNATTTTTTETNPQVEKYFYKLNAGHVSSTAITIPATEFTDDAGNTMTGNLTPVSTNNGYYLLFVNGVLQQSSLFTVGENGSQVVIDTPGSSVPISAPITLVVNNFVPISTSTTTITT